MFVFTLYYFNYDPFTREKEREKEREREKELQGVTIEMDTSSIENSINELKSLNEYINNGTSHRTALS
jgi:hypothetical protein